MESRRGGPAVDLVCPYTAVNDKFIHFKGTLAMEVISDTTLGLINIRN